ncbi:hypothetical protein KW796_02470 [Candidatus Parcubacteria bacterium]|nr:hypothetical protein [Candidatus Parcubacteria bacterium]
MAVSAAPTQSFVPIKEVRDGIIIEKDGGMRAILLASSLNFSLKSEDEKNAILLQFQDFLNSLDFSVQIVVQSRKLDIRPYLALLEEQGKLQTNSLMKVQTKEYIDFVRSFTESTNIMTKNFFIVVPYAPATIGGDKTSAITSFIGRTTPKSKAEAKESDFEESRTQLEERLAVVEQGLVRSGIRIARLGTDEVIELFYKAFNPGETEKALVKK